MDAIKITKSFENHLSTKDLVGLKTFLNDEKFLDILSQECLDVVPHVCNVFNERNEVDDAELITVCKKYIAEFARRSSPKEMLIALLEQSEKFNEDLLFLSILDALQVVLQRLPSKKVNLCRWVFETLYLNIKASKIPEAGDDEGQSKKDDDKSFKMHDILDSFVSFLEPFVESVELSPSSKSNFVDVESQGQLRNLLAVTLLRLIEFPIIFIDQSADEKFQHRYVRNIMDYLSRMTGDMFEYYNHRKLSESIESVKIGNFVEEHLTDVTSAGFAYLLIGLEIEKQKLPCVYSRAFVVRKNITQCLVLFRHFDNAIVLKGIVLAEKTFHHVDDRELDFDLSEFAELAMCVVNVMVNCPQTSVRQPAVKFLRDYLCKFDDKRRYDLVLMLLTSCKHSGVKGYLIQIYKTFLDASVVGKESCTFYETECLNRMVKAMIELPFGMEMDLLENSDQIIAAINFLRYLILQDINGNVGFYFHAASKVLCKFLNDLKTGVDISEAHYKTELQHSASEDDDAMMPISDDGHLSIIHRALNTFDVMRCLIARYEELFDICKRLRRCSIAESIGMAPRNFCQHVGDPEDRQENVKEKILDAALKFVADDGWSKKSLSKGAQSIGLSSAAHGMFQRGGIELVNFFYVRKNEELSDHLKKISQDNKIGTQEQMKVERFIRDAVEIRLRMIVPYIEKWPQAMAMMSLPQNLPETLRNFTQLVDDIWHHAGDTSADMNWYSKRLALATVYKTTELSLIQDGSLDFENTWKFLDRRMANLTSLRKVKCSKDGIADLLDASLIVVRNMMSLNNRNG